MPTEFPDIQEEQLVDALRCCEDSGDRPGLAESCYRLAQYCEERGRLDRAEALYRRSLVLNEALKNRVSVARAYVHLGLLSERRGEVGQARFFLQEAQGLYAATAEIAGLSLVCGHLGFLAFLEGDEAAAALYRRALALGEQAGDPALQAEQWANLGNIALQRGQWAEAQEDYGRALSLYEAAGDGRGIGNHHYRMGNWWLCQRGLAEARSCFEQGLDAQRRTGWDLGRGMNCEGLAQVFLLLGQNGAAEAMYREALGCFEQSGHLAHLALCHDRLGELQVRRGEWESACREYARALEIYEGVGNKKEAARVARNLGDAVFRAYPEHVDRAESLYLQALQGYQAAPDERGRGQVYIGLGNVALSRGEVSQAIAMWTTALEVSKRVGDSEQSRQLETALRQIVSAGRIRSAQRVS